MRAELALRRSIQTSNTIETSMMSISGDLVEYKEKLARLKRVLQSLNSYESELFRIEINITKPGFSSLTWQGDLSNKFKNKRNERIRGSHSSLVNRQLSATNNQIQQKIEQLQVTISNTESTLSQQRTRLIQIGQTINRQRQEVYG